MRAFQVVLNGKRICLAGIGEDGVLSAIITHVPFRKRRETRLHVGGLLLPQHEHVRWQQKKLRLGDEVRLRIVEKKSVDAPRTRFKLDPAFETKQQTRQLRLLARKLGYAIRKRSKRK